MERTSILVKIFIALCFCNFLNICLYGYESINYKLNVEYCIRKEKSNSKIKNKISESNIENGLKMISERSCIVFLQKSSCDEKKNICVKECTKKSQKCEEVPVTKSSPFIKFSFDKNSDIKEYNFDGSVDLMRTVEFEIKINENCNKNPGCVARKVLMYLGLIPTVRRSDRDTFVSVDDTKIKNEYKEQYSKLDNVLLYVNYDFSSIGHYSQYYGASSSETTFSIEKSYVAIDEIIGQEYRPAFSDLKWLYFAHCKKDPLYSLKCKNGGYPKSENSSECECPTGFSGETCDKLEKSDNDCHSSKLHTYTERTQTFELQGKKTCNILITSPPKTRIYVKIIDLNCETKAPCFENDCLQIKYQKDMALTGYCLCGKKRNVGMTTHSNETVIRYTGSSSRCSAKIEYKMVWYEYSGDEYKQKFL
uniref:Astacin domain-containing protein n=1 Tax=Strongyloides venezuelensis TaxID=75913 RepID=A0A0K0FGI4_STRVS